MIRISSLLAAGALACTAITMPPTLASANDAATVELSAQERQRGEARQGGGGRQGATTRTTTTRGGATVKTRTTTRPSGATTTVRSVDRKRGADVRTRTTTRASGATTRVKSVDRPKGADVRTKTTTRPSGATTRSKTTVSPSGTRKTTVTRTAPPPRQVTFTGDRRRFEGTRARAVWNANTGRWVYAGRNYTYWRRGPWRVRYNDGWRTFVAVSLVAPIVVGAATYYPYAYISAPADVCEGITEDGCQLTWTEVETVEGGTAPQCVAYCPWQ
jgi:hypothetical protein